MIGEETDVSCYEGSDGTIEITAPNEGEWVYNLYSEGVLVSSETSSNSSFVFTDLVAGIYTSTITNTNTSCVAQEILLELNQPIELNAAFTTQNSSCDGGDGSITILIEGGSPTYTTFLGGEDIDIVEQSGNNIVFDGLDAGDYYFTSIDLSLIHI